MLELLLNKEGQSRRAIKEFIESIAAAAPTAIEHMNKVCGALKDMHDQMKPVLDDMKPPKNGPKYNPHARRGKGGRR